MLSTFSNYVLSWLPQFDGQTIFSLIVGLIVSWLTFWWGYKNTIGAKEERIRAANFELTAAVLKRIAIEREPVTATQFDAVRRTKAYRAAVPERRLWPFAHILDAVMTDIFDNGFIDKSAKSAIIEVLYQSRASEVEVKVKETAAPPEYRWAVAFLVAFSGLLGALGYLFAGTLGPFLEGLKASSSSEPQRWEDVFQLSVSLVVLGFLSAMIMGSTRLAITARREVARLQAEQKGDTD